MMRQMALIMQRTFLQQQGPIQRGYRPPPEEILIVYSNQGPPPGAPPGGGRVLARSCGPARMPRERFTPFQGSGPPPAPGGATSPMPIRPRPLPAPPAQAPQPVPNRFPGRGQRLPDDRFVPFSGQGQRLPDQPRFAPFSGTGSRLPGESDTRANAIQRMREIAEQSRQRGRASEMVDRRGDLRRAVRRGGQQGDVVGAGKRKRDDDTFEPNPRTRRVERLAGPQRFTIAT